MRKNVYFDERGKNVYFDERRKIVYFDERRKTSVLMNGKTLFWLIKKNFYFD